ncbi:epididymal protein 13 [Ochotona princeps]|uniref:epididymal protein 13 n=1 Tax=Ochotona princeps TaxID=9978 RepID=UPI00064BC0F5|nr:epididymal protein 13 [Ochotona princeps]
MCRTEPLLKMSVVVLVFLGLADACIPQKVAVEEKSLLSLQVLSEETNDCKEEVKPTPATTPLKRPFPKRNTWNLLKCAYMMVTFLFMSYNKGDWCYCHYCNQELDIRDDPCCSF